MAPGGVTTRLIRLLGVDAGDVPAPAGAVILDQLGRRGAPRAGDREQRVEKVGLVLAAEIAARPAVQLCCPYQSVKSAPSFATRSIFGVRYPITPRL